ncbi:MAG: hypothetical protein ACLTDM_22410 [Clostridium butyricum]
MYNSKNKQWGKISTNEREVENTITAYYLSENKKLVEELVNNGYGIHRIISITSNLSVEDAYKVLCSLVEEVGITNKQN